MRSPDSKRSPERCQWCSQELVMIGRCHRESAGVRSIVIDTEVSPRARAASSELQEPQLLIDRLGLPLWTARLTGPVTGALMFRVGSGDEQLTQRGFTHLVEHLALSSFHDPVLQWNGFV